MSRRFDLALLLLVLALPACSTDSRDAVSQSALSHYASDGSFPQLDFAPVPAEVPLTRVAIDPQGNLLIEDLAEQDDLVTLSINGENVEVASASGSLVDQHGVVLDPHQPVQVPVSALSASGRIVARTGEGDDTLVVDYSGGNFPLPIDYQGGAQRNDLPGDVLVLEGGGEFDHVVFDYFNEHDGTVAVSGNELLTYSGLEPISSSLTTSVVTLNFGPSSEIITISDAGGGQTTVDSDVGGETTTFNNPSSQLDINAGGGNDEIWLNSLDGNLLAPINLQGEDGDDRLQLDYPVGAGGASIAFDGGLDQNNILLMGFPTSSNQFTFFNSSDGTFSTPGEAPLTFASVQQVFSPLETADAQLMYEGGIEDLVIIEGLAGDDLIDIASTQAPTLQIGGGTNQLTLDTGSGPDTLEIQSFEANFTGSISIISQMVTIQQTATLSLSPGSSFAVAAEQLTIAGIIAATSFGDIDLTATDGILLDGGILTSNDGSISLTANQDASTGGAFNGIELNNGAMLTSDNGDIVLSGRGGDDPGDNRDGIRIAGSSTVSGTGTGGIILNGQGGNGTNFNSGVALNNSTLQALDGDVILTGTGGIGTGRDNVGVRLEGGTIDVTGAGNTTLNGTSQSGPTSFLDEGVVLFSSSSITSASGSIEIIGVSENPSIAVNLGGSTITGGNNLDITASGPSSPQLFTNSTLTAQSLTLTVPDTTVTDETIELGVGQLESLSSQLRLSAGDRILASGVLDSSAGVLFEVDRTMPDPDPGEGGTVTITASLTAGLIEIDTGEDNDTISIQAQGAAGSTSVESRAGADVIDVLQVASPLDIDSGTGSDTISISNAGNSLDNIASGSHTINGGPHDSGTFNTLTIGNASNSVEVGDTLNLNDQGDVDPQTYSITASLLSRNGIQFDFSEIESVNLLGTGGAGTLDIVSTAPSSNTAVTLQGEADNVTIRNSGLDSNLTVDTAGGDDTVSVIDLGEDGSDSNTVGGFARLLGGTENDSLFYKGPLADFDLTTAAGDILFLEGQRLDYVSFESLVISVDFDWGDAPDSYSTSAASNGPYHGGNGALRLGSLWDAESDGLPSTAANGDDSNSSDDEDGVTFNSLEIGADSTSGMLTVTSNGSGLLNAWIDFNQDGDWQDPNEQIFTNRLLSNGSNSLSFTSTASIQPGTSMARFRFSTEGGLQPTGFAPDGEVEDYQVTLKPVDTLELTSRVESTSKTFWACIEISTGDMFSVLSGADITLHAGSQVRLLNESNVADGGVARLRIGSVPGCR